jgi:hypothetical protein
LATVRSIRISSNFLSWSLRVKMVIHLYTYYRNSPESY